MTRAALWQCALLRVLVSLVLPASFPLAVSAEMPTPATLEAAGAALEVGKITVPVQVVYAAETLPLWQLASRTVAGCVPNARPSTIEGVGHNGPVAAKDAFVKLMLGFVDAP
jgi:pimeloyl-ACP methyl ester carboxylesterase